MKITAMTIVVLMAGTVAVANGESAAVAAQRKVTVCIDRMDTLVAPGFVLMAQALASRMFADIGVTTEWHGVRGCPAQGILITLGHDTPESLQRGTLAYALPYEGTHIQVFYDRIVGQYINPQVPKVLGHVLAHEITHILQGVNRHSASGVMKAHWGPDDLAAMAWEPLRFEAHDIDLIYLGLAGRAAGTTLAMNAPGRHPTVAGQ